MRTVHAGSAEMPGRGALPLWVAALLALLAAGGTAFVGGTTAGRGTRAAPSMTATPCMAAGPRAALDGGHARRASVLGIPPWSGGACREVVAIEDAPFAAETARLASALKERDAGQLTAAIGLGPGALRLDRYTESEGLGTRLDRDEARALLVELFAHGSEPVVRGLFAAACRETDGPCTFRVVTTGWRGDVAIPTSPVPESFAPPPWPPLVTEAAAWEIGQDGAGGMRWTSWWLFDSYDALVDDLAVRDLGTYFAFR